MGSVDLIPKRLLCTDFFSLAGADVLNLSVARKTMSILVIDDDFSSMKECLVNLNMCLFRSPQPTSNLAFDDY